MEIIGESDGNTNLKKTQYSARDAANIYKFCQIYIRNNTNST